MIDRLLLPPAAAPQATGARFPRYEGKNLEGQAITIPSGLKGEVNLCLVPFLQWQQSDVDTWLRWLERSPLAERKGFAYYEFPTVQDRGERFQRFLDQGMARGIPDPVARARTITIYTDMSRFLKTLEVESRRQIQVYLIDREGRILWQTTGRFSAEKGQELSEFLGRLSFK